jgi:F-type H+-transporting ATPase subunit gamma
MASLRDIRTRIGSVKNTQQVTRAMKMVAAAKLRRAQERIFQTRPYAFKIRDVIAHLQGEVDAAGHPLFKERTVERALVIVITADRGLAGAFNTNAIKTAEETIRTRYADLQASGGLKIMAVGRKGHEHFAARDYTLEGDYRGTFDSLDVKTAQKVVDVAVQGFERGEWDEVVLVYNEFKNTISQNRVAEPLLPVPHEQFSTPVMEEQAEGTPEVNAEGTDYIFEPGPAAILDALVPRYLIYQVWRALLESNASEQGARMIAMDSATNNADDLLKQLKLTYNRARQSAITTEIIEIVSGANALENA